MTDIPAGAKKPSDRKPKKEPGAGRTVDVQGLRLIIAEDALDDFELLDDLNLLDEGDANAALKLPRILRTFFGADQYRTILDHLRGPAGRVSIEAGIGFVGDTMAALREANPN